MKIFDIADGVRLVGVKTDRFKTSRITFTMATPLAGNISAKAILPYFLHRRCAEYPDFSAFKGVLDELYGASVSASVSKQGEAMLLNINMTAIDDRFALENEKILSECASLLTKLVFEPIKDGDSFPSEIIEDEKRLLKERIESEQSDKRRYALSKCEEIMFSGEAYGKNCLGTVEEVSALTAKDIYSEWLYLLKSSVMQVTAVGSCEPEFIKELLLKKLAGIKREPCEIKTEFFAGLPKPNYVCETQPVKQGKLVMGFRTGMRDKDDNQSAMRVAVDIFGGGTYSKLFSIVREKMSLCYYCSASLYAYKGIVMVQSGIENVNEEKAKSEISNQLSQVAQGNFSDDDFSASIKSQCDARISFNDTPESLCLWYSGQILQEKPETPEESAAAIKAVERSQAIRAAKTIMLDTVYMLKSSEEGESNEN